jgi:hypothetical protein
MMVNKMEKAKVSRLFLFYASLSEERDLINPGTITVIHTFGLICSDASLFSPSTQTITTCCGTGNDNGAILSICARQ